MGKLPDTERKVIQAIWKNEVPIRTSAIREELQKEKTWNLSVLQALEYHRQNQIIKIKKQTC